MNNKITYLANKGLIVTKVAVASIVPLTTLTVSFSAIGNSEIPLQDRQLISAPVENESVNLPSITSIDLDRVRPQSETLIEQSIFEPDVEQNQAIEEATSNFELSLTKSVDLVKELEGFRASAYVDTDGTVVIGYGMSLIDGKRVQISDRISQVEAETALETELGKIQQQILAVTTIELSSNQLSALTSFAFNVGVEPLTKSTLLRKLNTGDVPGAANEFPRWNRVNMGNRLIPLTGLTKRRLTEKNLFLAVSN